MATFGETSIVSALTDGVIPNDQIEMSRFTLSEAGVVSALTMYCGKHLGNSDAKGVIVNTSLALLGVTTATALPNGFGWTTFTFGTGVSLGAGNYYLGIIAQTAGANYYYFSGGGPMYVDSTNSYTTPTNPTDATSEGAYHHCIYATYTPSGGGLSIPVAMNLYRQYAARRGPVPPCDNWTRRNGLYVPKERDNVLG